MGNVQGRLKYLSPGGMGRRNDGDTIFVSFSPSIANSRSSPVRGRLQKGNSLIVLRYLWGSGLSKQFPLSKTDRMAIFLSKKVARPRHSACVKKFNPVKAERL